MDGHAYSWAADAATASSAVQERRMRIVGDVGLLGAQGGHNLDDAVLVMWELGTVYLLARNVSSAGALAPHPMPCNSAVDCEKTTELLSDRIGVSRQHAAWYTRPIQRAICVHDVRRAMLTDALHICPVGSHNPPSEGACTHECCVPVIIKHVSSHRRPRPRTRRSAAFRFYLPVHRPAAVRHPKTHAHLHAYKSGNQPVGFID